MQVDTPTKSTRTNNLPRKALLVFLLRLTINITKRSAGAYTPHFFCKKPITYNVIIPNKTFIDEKKTL